MSLVKGKEIQTRIILRLNAGAHLDDSATCGKSKISWMVLQKLDSSGEAPAFAVWRDV